MGYVDDRAGRPAPRSVAGRRQRHPKAGSKFQVRVLLDGKPVAGVMVENNSNEAGPKTDADGRATLTLVKGINRLAVDYDIPMKDDPDTDKLGLNASLVFMTK